MSRGVRVSAAICGTADLRPRIRFAHPDYLPALKLFGAEVAVLAIIAAAEHDKAVAEVIGYVMRLNGALRG